METVREFIARVGRSMNEDHIREAFALFGLTTPEEQQRFRRFASGLADGENAIAAWSGYVQAKRGLGVPAEELFRRIRQRLRAGRGECPRGQ